MNPIKISEPFVGEEEKKLVLQVLESGILAQGARVKELEEKFADFCGTDFAVAVNSGTAALHSALYALGIKNGDEVITTPFSFVATANSILMQNAKIVFADINEKTFNISPEQIEKKISKKTKAIIAVDLYGQPADYKKIREISEKHGLKILEDACQAHAAELSGVKAGKLADIACFSFYATKNMMSGEGGIITTDNADFAKSCRRFRHHGQSEQRYEYLDIGYNYRLTDLQAAIAIAQLGRLGDFTKKRIENAALLTKGLGGIPGIEVPFVMHGAKHVFHQYTIKCDNKEVKRDGLLNFLKANGIGAGIYYPSPLHLQPHFLRMGFKKGDFPVAEKISLQVISLPVHPKISAEQINFIVSKIREFVSK